MPAERPPMLPALEALAADLGADREIVQGAGGNGSLKHEGVLWVKASGTWMVDALRRPTFVAVELAAVQQMLRRDASAFDQRALPLLHGSEGTRPSIETPLHAVMPQAVVMHVHSVRALAFAVRADAAALLVAQLHGMRWAFVPYRRPGVPLTEAIADAIARAAETPDVLVLGNHGLVVAGDDVTSVRARLRAVEGRLDGVARTAPPARLDTLHAWMGSDPATTWRMPRDPLVHGLGTDPASFRAFSTGVLYPDHVVFLGSTWPAALPDETLAAANRRHRAQHGCDTPYWVVEGAGVIVRGDLSNGAESMLECAALVGQRLGPSDHLTTLREDDVAALTHWEAETYRTGLERNEPCSS